jgi:hypothetical protein
MSPPDAAAFLHAVSTLQSQPSHRLDAASRSREPARSTPAPRASILHRGDGHRYPRGQVRALAG